jgi:hypothetical protein
MHENLGMKYILFRFLPVLAILATLLVAATPQASANSVTVVSNGSATFLDSGSSTTDFSSALTSAQFAAAQTGTSAFVLSSTPFYATAITGTSWIGTNSVAGQGGASGDTALYAVSFVLPSAVSSASLSLSYYVDNDLGSNTNDGVFINGIGLPGSNGIPCGPGAACGNAFNPSPATPNTFTDASIASLLMPGTNYLYIDAVNLGAEAGLDFSATITYTPAGTVGPTTTPEPSSLITLATGLVGLIGIAGRKLRRA